MAATPAVVAAIPVLNRIEQQRRYGIDCGDMVSFDAGTWLPGGEHVKHITVKNVSKRSIKFKYELPSTKYFSMDFPMLTTLSPGMHTVLDVAFRPVKLEEYDDDVIFHVHMIEGGVTATSGKFRLPVMARIASLSINIPRGLDFGFCPTAETTDVRFQLLNDGQIDALFDWTVPGAGSHGEPFAVNPPTGCVRAGGTMELTASFSPVEASVFVATALCIVRPINAEAFVTAPRKEQLMKISGISKFTHLSASETELNFGEILVGAQNTARAPTEKEFVLRNRSLVRATFQILNVENDHDPVFAFSPLSGVVPPESSLTVRVKYTPLSAGTFTCDHFDVVTPGGNSVRITCKGKAVGPVVSLWKKNLASNLVSTRSINFKDVPVGKLSSRVLILRNESPIEVFFHFDCQQHGVFGFDKTSGRIAPFLEMNVTISFAPTQPGNFYRRMFILLQNQTTTFVDILGTGYDDKTRPSPFQQAHVDAYRLRAARGLGLLSPDQLETYWQDHGDDLFLRGALRRSQKDGKPYHDDDDTSCAASVVASPKTKRTPPDATLSQNQVLTRSGEASIADVQVCHEYFVSIEDKGNAIVGVGALLDFGSTGVVQLPSRKVLHVTNNTHGKVTCTWRVAAASGTPLHTFQVFPETCDLSAGASVEFRVAFQPTQSNAYYFAELEGYVSFKTNRTFRLVNVQTFTPPWCLVARVCGNTFASPTEQFLSKISFRLLKHKVQFPPCYLGDSVFQTLLMENASDTPALFAFVGDPTEVFTCKPNCGYIPAKSFHLVQIRFSPRKVKQYTFVLQCIVNNARSAPETLELTGICAVPQLEILAGDDGSAVDDPKVFVKPTAIGLQSTRPVVIRNASRVPLVFRWEVPRKYDHVFHVTPQVGRLNGRESVQIDCSFTPTDVREYLTRFVMLSKPISVAWNEFGTSQARIPVLQEAAVRVQTKGTTGAILFDPEHLTFETILVNTSSKKRFFIVNTAVCDLHFALRQTIEVTATDTPVEDDVVPARLAFSEDHGCIPARSRKQISATFLPAVAGSFEFEISCVIVHGNVGPETVRQGSASRSRSPSTKSPTRMTSASTTKLCRVRAEASFPTLVIDDIRVPRQPTNVSWKQFDCHAINEYLSAPLTKAEQRRNQGGLRGGQGHNSNVDSDSASNAEQDTDEDETTKRFLVPFSPAPLGSLAECVYIKLRNPGSLIVEYALRYPKEGNVEIEHWAETGAPSSEEVRTNAIIDSHVFEISPRRATLRPHESVVLLLAYNYASDAYGGVHDLPMFLQVEKGKRLVLELQGRTLARNEPKLFLPQRVFLLSPVMVGEFQRHKQLERDHQGRNNNQLDQHAGPFLRGHAQKEDHHGKLSGGSANGHRKRAPVQQIQVWNRGESALRIEVGEHSLHKLNGENYDFPVLTCAMASEIIPAKSAIFVDLEFNPLEAKTIEAHLIIKAHGLMGRTYKEALMVTIIATGYHPHETTLAQLRREFALAEPPRQQLVVVPDQPARFVSDYVDFGHVTMYSQMHQLVVLENISSGTLTFEWDATHPLVANACVQFSPKKGDLGPGKSALIRVTVQTFGEAFVLEHDIACNVQAQVATAGSDSGLGSDSTGASDSTLSLLSPGKQSKTRRAEGTGARTSVVLRSTATQEAAIEKKASWRDAAKTSPRSRAQGPSGAAASSAGASGGAAPANPALGVPSDASADGSQGAVLHVRIYAHVLPNALFERHYPREQIKKLPLPLNNFPTTTTVVQPREPLTPLGPSGGKQRTASGASRSARVGVGANTPGSANQNSMNGSNQNSATVNAANQRHALECRQTVSEIMEMLVLDVLHSDAVQEAIEKQLTPLSPVARAEKRGSVNLAKTSRRGSRKTAHGVARKSDDCQAIVATIMENTVFNILQELFHGDLEKELLCVPRKQVFPTPAPTKKLMQL
ncbi:TPA: hypothetical protein N0F65_003137 [Lagenidium giganteum]|uniref:Abnormal spindle-like microcephaly-associated protein ASH domain-containing protein n=1 Tax=Lagenidium giganteum TaxID=4803 RepID=A0AAV2YDU4_9STRA|nr:TPA: hypothetical protein N0F65_003137 [Lagenidium giganteum]